MTPSKLTPHNVLIAQLGSLRDCLLTVPLAVDVKRMWPEAKVSWVVESSVGQLLNNHSCVDQVIEIEHGWLKSPSATRRISHTLRDQNFDLVLDPLGLTKSAVVGWLSRAKTRLGFRSPRGREISPWFATYRVTSRARHRVDSNRELLSPWSSIEAGQGEFSMPTYELAASLVETKLADLDICLNSEWAALHPGAIWPTAHWPVDRFAVVARRLYEDHGLQSLVLWSGENERLLSHAICENSGGVARAAPALALDETAEFLRRSLLFIGGDSDPLHLASSVGTPTLSLHGPTWADEFGAYGRTHVAIQSPIPNISRRMIRRGPNTAMQAIELDEVLYGANRLLCRIQKASTSRVAA